MRLPHHLLRHASGMYHFRLVVPRDLHARLGRRIIKRSLHTRDLSIARVGAWRLSAGYAQVFAVLRGSTMTKPPDIEEVLAALRAGHGSTYVLDIPNGIMKATGRDDHDRLMEAMKAHERMVRANTQAAAAREEARLAPLRDASEAEFERLMQDIPLAPARTTHPAGGITVNEMIAHWETVEAADLSPGTAATRRKMIEDFAQHYGQKRPLNGVRKTDLAAWMAVLADRGNTNSTRKTKASHLKMFFRCAIDAGYYPTDVGNPAEGIQRFTKMQKAARAVSHGWDAFTLDQLQTLFTPANLKRTREPHTRRAMVIGLYTGARVAEIAQLHLADFTSVGGVKCLTVQRDVKTPTSRRMIPIHPDLLELGLWEWVEEQRERGEPRLFPGVRLDGKSGKGNAISKGTSNLLGVLKIGPEEGKTTRLGFHSFRSTVIQELQGADPKKLQEERRRAYVGHAAYEKQDDTAHRAHYMRPWKPSEIEGLHGGITWGKWLDFDGLKTLLAQSDSDAVLKARERAHKRAK